MKVKLYFIISLIAFLLSVNSARPASAENWKLYHTSIEGKMYYDQNSIKQIDGNIVQLLTKTILNEKGKINAFAILKKMKIAPCNAQKVSHEVTLEQYDCLNKKYKILSTTIYNTKNESLASQKAFGNKWSNVSSKSIVSKLMNIVCNTNEAAKIDNK